MKAFACMVCHARMNVNGDIGVFIFISWKHLSLLTKEMIPSGSDRLMFVLISAVSSRNARLRASKTGSLTNTEIAEISFP